MNATFADLIIEKCAFDGEYEAQSIIEVAECRRKDALGLVTLHRFIFRQNNLTAASALRMSSPSCSELKMVEVEISENTCLGEACGVHLAQKNLLEDCTISKNRVTDADAQKKSSLFYGGISSNTTIRGFAASENSLTIIRIRKGKLSLTEADFQGIYLELGRHIDEKMASQCVHSIESSIRIELCSFFANRAFRGSVVFAKKSSISVFYSSFTYNEAENGGCIYAEGSKLVLKHTVAGNYNRAHNNGGFLHALDSSIQMDDIYAGFNIASTNGGFMHAENCNTKLKETHAANNYAWESGGFMYAENSNAKLERTNAFWNTAREDGGFLSAYKSNVTLDHTNATDNRAYKNGAFVYARYSNVTLGDTNAKDNKATDGAFVYAENCTTKLKETHAAKNHAWASGGFMFVKNSEAKLERTNAIRNIAGDNGGFLNVEKSNIMLEHTDATANSASNGAFVHAEYSNVTFEITNAQHNSALKSGGVIYAEDTRLILKHTDATNNNAMDDGGFVYAKDSTLTIAQSHISLSTSNATGGFASVSGKSSIIVNDTSIVQGRSKKGGAIWMDESHLKAVHLSITRSEAEVDGGGVLGLGSSSILCANCVFQDNSAKQGNGGAVFLDAKSDQGLALQFVQSSFENNKAKLGGRQSLCKNRTSADVCFRRTLLRLQREQGMLGEQH